MTPLNYLDALVVEYASSDGNKLQLKIDGKLYSYTWNKESEEWISD